MDIAIYKSLANFQLPNKQVFQKPVYKPLPESPFESPFFNNLFVKSLHTKVPLIIAFVYFISVHLSNKYIRQRQIRNFKKLNPFFDEFDKKNFDNDDNKQKLNLPAAPFKIAQTKFFKLFVLLHNIFLCIYSIWTFIGMTSTIYKISHIVLPSVFDLDISNIKQHKNQLFWQTICNLENGIWSPPSNTKGLAFYSYWFYLSKFYEVVDTIIILLKGKPSSLLQSYHHAGAMLSMWSGVRFTSPPIWVFVVFNSFIHSIMYGYFTLSCLHIKIPKIYKQILTTMQILQFILGGSLAVAHLFVEYYDHLTDSFKSCIVDSSQAMAIWINVIYLTPLTMLFGAFWIESYVKKNVLNEKKKDQ